MPSDKVWIQTKICTYFRPEIQGFFVSHTFVGQKYFSMAQTVNKIYDNFALNFLTKAPRKSLSQ